MDGSALLESKYWHNDFGEELMSELLDETAAAPVHITEGNQGEEEEEGTLRRRESMVNKLISTVYSGPTISDIESALSFTGGDQLVVDARKYNSSPVVFSPEKVLSKMENKYTLKIKTSGNGLAEDGYKWRKYGQKSIKNSPNPRSYYRCTNPRCNAKKQVERATDEPDTLVVTYEGLHLHYTYSHFLHQQQHHHQQGAAGGGGSLLSSSSSNSSLPKKPKLHTRGAPPTISPDHHNIIHSSPTSMLDLDGPSALLITTQDEMSPLDTAGAAAMAPPPPTIASQVVVPAAAAADSSSSSERVVLPAASSACCYFDDGLLVFQQVQENFQHHEVVVEEQQQQQMVGASNGLLEDVVPLLVRRPCSSGATTTSTSSSPPSPSTSSVSWTPTLPYIDMAILSNIF